MRFRNVVVVALLAAVSACKSAAPAAEPGGVTPVAAAAANPVGRWEVSLDANGQPIMLVLDIRRGDNGALTGTASSDMFPMVTLSKVEQTGNKLYMESPTPMGTIAQFEVTIDGDTMAGEWSTSGMGSRLTGKRIR